MNLKKVISLVSKDMDIYLKIPVSSGETVLTRENVQVFLKDNPNATHIQIPEGVATICKWAFSGCSGLKSVTIPEGVTIIESYAFYGCSGLKGVTIPEGVSTIGRNVFRECTGLK